MPVPPFVLDAESHDPPAAEQIAALVARDLDAE